MSDRSSFRQTAASRLRRPVAHWLGHAGQNRAMVRPSPEELLADAWIESTIAGNHPDYRATLIAAAGLRPGPGTEHSERTLQRAEDWATELLVDCPPQDLPQVQIWRAAYLAFGVKPRTARSSVEALLRRAPTGLPRIDRLTDIYNAVSVSSLLPIGGEDAGGYVGAPRLVVATGTEAFDTVADGEPAVQYAEAGEPVWRDDLGVTCRRWNWRQCVRTRLGGSTTDALFIIDGLGPDAQDRGEQAAATLIDLLAVDSPSATFTVRALTA